MICGTTEFRTPLTAPTHISNRWHSAVSSESSSLAATDGCYNSFWDPPPPQPVSFLRRALFLSLTNSAHPISPPLRWKFPYGAFERGPARPATSTPILYGLMLRNMWTMGRIFPPCESPRTATFLFPPQGEPTRPSASACRRARCCARVTT